MNAGYIPSDSWVQDMKVGGGRVIGEACHLIDLITFFVGSSIKSVSMQALGSNQKLIQIVCQFISSIKMEV